VRKCPYCDFNSFTLQGELPQESYIDALLLDLRQQAQAIAARPLQSIFFGGGTPSLFAPAALSRLLGGLLAQCRSVADLEVTLEANPGTIERGRFAEYRAAGITRVSLGAQSFDNQQLRRLGRIHAALDTARAVEELRAAGIDNFNLDLMYALPEQSLAAAQDDLARAIELQPSHLSHYQLTLEPGTVFAGRPPAGLPDLDAAADMQMACQERLASAGFRQYEVSAYARDAARCRHNLNYWEFGDYLGLGAGAHGKNTRRTAAGLVVDRSERPRDPRRYLAQVQVQGEGPRQWSVTASGLAFEYFLNALRLTEGFEITAFEARTGLTLDSVRPSLERAQRLGLLRCSERRWRPTARGLNFLNDLQALFLPEMSEDTKSAHRTSPTSRAGTESDGLLYTQSGTLSQKIS
jgi:oxygen-independent coproporphyrinogen-3 oxidase